MVTNRRRAVSENVALVRQVKDTYPQQTTWRLLSVHAENWLPALGRNCGRLVESFALL